MLSAIGALSQHLGPVILIAVVADNRASLIEAGWIITARALGDLLATFILPAMGVYHLGRLSAIATTALMIVAYLIATLNNINLILLGFLLVGFCCGVLKYLGTMAASAYLQRTFAFVFRLSFVLIIAGSATIYLLSTHSFASYSTLLISLVFLIAVLSLIGTAFYRPIYRQKESTLEHPEGRRATATVGLLTVGLFFIGISGSMAYIGERALARGLSMNDTILAIGATKGLAGVAVLGTAFYMRKDVKGGGPIAMWFLIAAVWGVFLSRNAAEFFVGLLVLEISLNTYGGWLQSAITGVASEFSARWLNLVILLGTAAGPSLYGLAIASGQETSFLLFACVAIVLSLVWQRTVRA